MNEIIRTELAEAKEVCPTTSRRLLNEGALLIDVREADEAAKTAFAGCDVINIPLSEFETRWQEVPRDRDVIVACATGNRSLKATYFLMYQGYQRVANMNPGIARWVERGFPIIGSASVASGSDAKSSCCGGGSSQSESDCGCGPEAGNCC